MQRQLLESQQPAASVLIYCIQHASSSPVLRSGLPAKQQNTRIDDKVSNSCSFNSSAALVSKLQHVLCFKGTAHPKFKFYPFSTRRDVDGGSGDVFLPIWSLTEGNIPGEAHSGRVLKCKKKTTARYPEDAAAQIVSKRRR